MFQRGCTIEFITRLNKRYNDIIKSLLNGNCYNTAVLPCTASPSAWRCLWTEKVGKALVTPQFEEGLDEEDTSYFMIAVGIKRLTCWFGCSRKSSIKTACLTISVSLHFPASTPFLDWKNSIRGQGYKNLLYQWLDNIPKGRDIPK